MMTSLFGAEPEPCPHGRVDGCPFCLARGSDPATSATAASSLDHTITNRHLALIQLYRAFGPLTDDEAAVRAVDAGLATRHESARRMIRTMRENHHLLVAALDPDGYLTEHINESGRNAVAYEENTNQ
jgi:hypothetical protein